MEAPFRISRLPELYMGEGMLRFLPGIVSGIGNKVLLIRGNRSLDAQPNWIPVEKELRRVTSSFREYRINQEPSPDIIDQIAKENRSLPPDVVIAVGGGSVLDTGKAVSAMIPLQDSVIHYLEGVGNKTHPGCKIPFIAIPTTAGTGSEATKNAVISKVGHSGFKKSLRHDQFVPDIALVDPVLTYDCPPVTTAYTGMDCLTQLIESFLSKKSNPFTDSLSLPAIKKVLQYLPVAYNYGQDPEARSAMAYAAYISGICLANAGLGSVHGMASVIGGQYPVPHGKVCAILMGPLNRATVAKLHQQPENVFFLKKYKQLDDLLVSEQTKKKQPGWAFCEYLEQLAEQLQIPGFLSLGISPEDLGKILDLTDHKNNPVVPDDQYVMDILSEIT